MRMLIKFSYYATLLVPQGGEAAMTAALMGCMGVTSVGQKYETGKDPGFEIQFIDDSALVLPGSDASLAEQLKLQKAESEERTRWWQNEQMKTKELKEELEGVKAGLACLQAKQAETKAEVQAEIAPPVQGRESSGIPF